MTIKSTIIYIVTYTCGHVIEETVKQRAYSDAAIEKARAGTIERQPVPAVVKCADCARMSAVESELIARRDREWEGSMAQGCYQFALDRLHEHAGDWRAYVAILRAAIDGLAKAFLLSEKLREDAIALYEGVIDMCVPVGQHE